MRSALFAFWLLAMPVAVHAQSPDQLRRLAIYDAFAATIDTTYYDPQFAGIPWAQLRDDGRDKAARVGDDAHLYSDVLYPITRAFHVSHLTILEPLPADGQSPQPMVRPVVQPYEMRKLAGEIAYIRFDIFDGPSIDQVIDRVGHARHGVILDLRHNRGGSAEQQQRLLSLLLPGNTVYGRNRSRAGEQVMRTDWFGKHYTGKLVVLIGPDTASAGEITAAALQGARRATLIGETTRGQVLNANVYPLPGGGAVQVPVADFVTADGRRIEGAGVTPDIVSAEGVAPDRAVVEILNRR